MRYRSTLAVVAIACIMLAGLSYILQRHAQQAESYPPFSSFRTLPEGTSVFYEALGHRPAMAAERNTKTLGAVHYNNAAILVLGVQLSSLTDDNQWFSDMEELAGKGDRVIIGLQPHRFRFRPADNDRLEEALKRWGVRLGFVLQTDLRDDEEDSLIAGWPMYFAQAKNWDVTREENGRAVVIERSFGKGKGTIVLMANPYLLSNAAMVDDRQTVFLLSLIGPVHQAIFDETHFGIEETGSIAALARRYRLQGLILGLVITACLFIWRSAAGFPPPLRSAHQAAQGVLGEDGAAAFVNLLRRNIRKEDILATCIEAWRKMYERKAGPSLATAIDLAETGRKTPAQTYARIQQVLSEPRLSGRGYHPTNGAKQNQS